MSKPSGAIDMTQGKPINLMLRFALPMMIGSIFQSLYSMVDSAVLGRFVGSHALAAIGATTSTTGLILLLATGVTSAISIVLSQYVGANDTDRVRKSIVASGWITLLLGVVLGLISVFAARPLMQLLKTPEDVIDMSVLYIQIVCGCGIAQFAYNAAASILRALGDSKTPLYFLILCSILNVILDLISVIGLNMGVAGVAVATVGSQAISAAICILVMFRKYPDLMPKRHTLRPDMPVSLKIFGMGAQMALQSLFLSVGMMVITRVINSYGSNVVAAFTVGSNVQNLAVMLFSNFSFGFSVYVGQNFGAKNAERIKLGVRQIFLLVGGLSIFAGALTLIFSELLVSLYVKPNETEVIRYSLEFIRIQAWFFPFLGWIWLYNSTVKGMGKINISMVSSVVELCSKIGLSLLLPIWIGTTGIWFAAPIGYILGIIPLLIYYYSGRWKKLLTVPAAEPAKA